MNAKRRVLNSRVQTGIPGFDELVQGGLKRDTSVLLVGDAGSGKTLFGLQYLFNGVTKFRESGVYLSFSESRQSIFSHAEQFGWNLEKLEAEKKFSFIKYEPHEVASIVKEGGGTIRDTIDSIGAKRLVIDSITAYSMLFDKGYESSQALLHLFEMLKKWNCTSLLISEELVTLDRGQTDRASFLADGVIYLYHIRKQNVRVRAVEVLKMRDTMINEKICPLEIGGKGLVVYPRADVFEATEGQ
jgi:circadian clock protein KaiC